MVKTGEQTVSCYKSLPAKNGVGLYTCENSASLIDLLANRLMFNVHTDPSQGWIFRGQGDSKWPLLPSVFRPLPYSEKASYTDFNEIFPYENIEKQLNYEADLLISFLKLADRVGLQTNLNQKFYQTTKDWGLMLKSKLIQRYKEGKGVWDSWAFHSLALAQHHGVPTRLLDFTKELLINIEIKFYKQNLLFIQQTALLIFKSKKL